MGGGAILIVSKTRPLFVRRLSVFWCLHSTRKKRAARQNKKNGGNEWAGPPNSGEKDISGECSDRECPLHEFLAVLLNKFCCFCSAEQLRCSVLGCSHNRTVGGWDNHPHRHIYHHHRVVNRMRTPIPLCSVRCPLRPFRCQRISSNSRAPAR